MVHVTRLTFMLVQMSMPEDQLKNVKCMACNINCFIECLYCYSLLECRGKEHNCPVAEEDKVEGIPDYFGCVRGVNFC